MNDIKGLSQNKMIILFSGAMVILFIMGIALVVINPMPDKIPQANLKIIGEDDIIYADHTGGDMLSNQNTIVKVNGQNIPNQQIMFLNGQWPWSSGETIRFTYPENDSKRVVEVYSVGKKGDEYLIDKETIIPPEPEPVHQDISVVPEVSIVPTLAPTMIPVNMQDANPDQPPASDFTSDKRVGDPPFTVQFKDLSWGVVDNYQWSFGDGTTSMLQNPVHTYFVPGSYTVSLLVSNDYGSNRKTRENFITIGSPPITDFLVEPQEGNAPMTIQCTDLSTGSPKTWEWNFGDGKTSNLQNPTHIYQEPGKYTILLTVTNSFGTDSLVKKDHITVNSPTLHDIYIVNSEGGNLESGGYIKFRVTDSISSIKVAGKIFNINENDVVQLIIEETSDGQISATSSEILSFNFNDVSLFINDEFVKRGVVNDVNIRSYDSYLSTLGITTPKSDKIKLMYIDENRISYVQNPKMIFENIGPDSWGRMNYKKSLMSMDYQGGAEQYQIA